MNCKILVPALAQLVLLTEALKNQRLFCDENEVLCGDMCIRGHYCLCGGETLQVFDHGRHYPYLMIYQRDKRSAEEQQYSPSYDYSFSQNYNYSQDHNYTFVNNLLLANNYDYDYNDDADADYEYEYVQ